MWKIELINYGGATDDDGGGGGLAFGVGIGGLGVIRWLATGGGGKHTEPVTLPAMQVVCESSRQLIKMKVSKYELQPIIGLIFVSIMTK